MQKLKPRKIHRLRKRKLLLFNFCGCSAMIRKDTKSTGEINNRPISSPIRRYIQMHKATLEV